MNFEKYEELEDFDELSFAEYLINTKKMTWEDWESKNGLYMLKAAYIDGYSYLEYKKYCEKNDIIPERIYI